ncbi:hypothetical protein Hanom_Chr14g01251071 [Helianthus anomalus]
MLRHDFYKIFCLPTQQINIFLEGITPFFTSQCMFLQDKYRNSKEYRQSSSESESNETVTRTEQVPLNVTLSA